MELFDPSPHALAVLLVSATDAADAARVAAALAGRSGRPPEDVVDPPGDSVRLAEELAAELGREADAGRRGVSVVALDPLADTLEVGLVLEHLCTRRGGTAPRVAVLDVVAVTSVDEILDVLVGRDGSSPAGDAGVAERLASRIEFASLVVLAGRRGARASTPADDTVAVDLVHALAPSAQVVRPHETCRLSYRLIPGRAHALAASMGWQRALNGTGRGAGRTDPVQEFVFRDPLPLHPGRLAVAVRDELVPERVGRILRSRGLVRLATRADRVGSWSIAGDVLSLDPTAIPSWDADAPLGQELAFFGLDLDADALTDVLNRCLLTPNELLLGPQFWAGIDDPFPAWEQEHHH
ncbi:GTP-binding protein [Rathayibacter sp. VKM Ac-2760]|uniref:GTP-binding protein n=1 Tax=Rathayibacter sp. VKM Ac-2760 TaxID=2609253 RepID=UPI0013194F3E|nr:GTP-binding protein [Rathayibacter sp. VKM Ac-2760]QHC58044.1 cobalamin biosynthesis protein CobW [Rathayibacter sp. VKM Ac-2760]